MLDDLVYSPSSAALLSQSKDGSAMQTSFETEGNERGLDAIGGNYDVKILNEPGSRGSIRS